MNQQDQTNNITLLNEESKTAHRESTKRNKTNLINIEQSEIKEIKLSQLPKGLRTEITLFKVLHYFLLIIAIISIIYRRRNEINDILEAQKKDTETQNEFYLLSSLIYVKYNLEVLNFVIFVVFVYNFAEK